MGRTEAVPRLLGLGVVVAIAGGLALAWGPGGSGTEPDGSGAEEAPERVRIAYVVESSWFATDPAIVERNLADAASHMETCAEGTDRTCEVMMFAARGADIADGRVPQSLQPDPETGFWYDLAGGDTDNDILREELTAGRIGEFVARVRDEIVPGTYPDQDRGCVNLIDNMASALEQFESNPGDRNIIVVYASGISNCENQPFYGQFPATDVIVDEVLADIPEGSGVVGRSDAHVCVDWTPMFGQGWLERDVPISNEQGQQLASAWEQILGEWGAEPGNSPGEGIPNCLTMEGTA